MTLLAVWRNAAAARAVAAFFFILGLGFANWVPRIPEIQARLGMSDGELGLALLAMPAGSVLSMPVAGALVERLGSARTTRLAMIVYGLFLIGPALVVSKLAFAGGLALVGLGIGSLDVAMNAEAAAVERRYGRPIMSACHGMFSIGAMIGAAGGGLVAEWSVPLAPHLGGAAVVLLALGFVFGRQLEEVPVEPRSGPLLRLPSRALIGLGLLALFAFLGEGAVFDWSAVFMVRELGASPFVGGLGFAAFSLTMAIGRLLGDAVALRIGPLGTLRAGGLLGAAGMALVIGAGGIVPAVIGFGLAGAGYAAIVPIVFRSAAQRPGLPPGPSLAAVVTAAYAGLLAGPPAIGFLAEAFGLPAALGVVVLLGLLIAVLAGPFGVERRLELTTARA